MAELAIVSSTATRVAYHHSFTIHHAIISSTATWVAYYHSSDCWPCNRFINGYMGRLLPFTWWLTIQSLEEFKSMMNGYVMNPNRQPGLLHEPTIQIADDSVDWRTEGYVTPVKNQVRHWHGVTSGTEKIRHSCRVSLTETKVASTDLKTFRKRKGSV